MDSQQNSNSTAANQIPAEVRSFLEGILNDAGMTTLDDQMKEEMVNELYARLDNYLASTIIENLSPEDAEEFTRLNEAGKPREEVEKYLMEHMQNPQDVMAEAFSEFRALYLGNVAVVRNAPSNS